MPIVYTRVMCSASRKEKTHIYPKLEALFITGIALIGHGLLMLGTDVFVSAAAQVSGFVARSTGKSKPSAVALRTTPNIVSASPEVFAEFSAQMRTWAPRPASSLLLACLLLFGALCILPEAFSTPGPRRSNLAQPRKASPSEPAARIGDSSGLTTPISAGAVACLLLLASALPNAAVAQDFFGGGGPDDGVDRRSLIERSPPQPPPADDKAPDIAPEERQRRRTTPSTDIASEEWYKYGKEVFVAKCAGCHPGGMNQIRISKGLNVEDLERWGLLQEGSSLSQICAEP
ncbi:petJ [Symbiodinium sp. CCMP2592]|nr:petJ [Symbiodinium sp. CCMP2592]